MSKTREQYPLSPKKIIKKTVSSTLGLVILFLFFALFMAGFIWRILGNVSSDLLVFTSLGALGFLLLIITLVYLYQRWYFAVYYYDLTSDFIVIRKGPITPREITIPYERIQDVYVDQDLLDRAFGIFDVHLSSATITSGMEAHIDGVEKQAADGLKAALLKIVHERISKNRTNAPIATTPS